LADQLINVFMKLIYLSLIALVCGTGTMAQQDFYIFIQEPSHQPFYVRMGEESHSSSAEGHIILSKLKDSVYNLYIGFPKIRGENLFNIPINKKDHGYELQNVNGRRQLFDLQTFQMIIPVASTQSDGQTIRKTDSYSELMAGVVDDSAVLYTSPADTMNTDTVFANGKADSVAAVTADVDTTKVKNVPEAAAAVDSTAVNKDAAVTVAAVESTAVKKEAPDAPDAPDVNNNNVKNEAIVLAPVVAASPDSSVRDKRDIIRLRTENVKEGKLIIYVDRSSSVNDTIRIIIPKKS